MPLKLGFVTGEYPPMEGGVGAFTQELAKAVAAEGHEVHIITDRRARPPQQQRAKDLFEPIDIGFAQLHPRIRGWRWASLATIVDIAIRHDLDILNIQYQAAAYNMRNPAINCLPWRAKGVVKTIVTFHDLRVPYLFPKAGLLRPWIVKFMARQAHGVITTNIQDHQQIGAQLITPLTQIPIGSNIATYTPKATAVTAARQQLGLLATDILLGYFGFLNESKGADTLLHALATLDTSVHLIFIGGQTGSSDPDNNRAFFTQLKQLIQEQGLTERVHWSGFLADEAVSTYLQAADVMVMPYRDGASLRRGTLMAALAHKRPLISTIPTVATPELVHGENVWLVPPDDAPTLANAIQTLTTTPTLSTKLSQGAGQLADRFAWDKIAQQTLTFCQQLTTNNQQ